MTDHPLTVLRSLFVDRYDDLKSRLTRRLGSADLAGDAMQDAWLRLVHTDGAGIIQSPHNYLFRIALNAAHDRRQRERRHGPSVEIEHVQEVPDEAPSAEQALLARSDLAVFEAIIAELPEQRRAIFLAARLADMPRQEIADRVGISLRSVAREIALAHRHLLVRYLELKG